MSAVAGWGSAGADGDHLSLPAARARRMRGVQLLAATPAVITDMAGLLEADREFAAAVPEADRPLAAGPLRLPCQTLQPGEWVCPQAGADAPAGLVVLSGLISRTVTRYGRESVELYGPSDLIVAEEPGAVQWDVHQPSSLIVLDDRFALAARRWPGLWQVLVDRASQRADRLTAHLAALQLSRVEDRIHAVLWQLAERWGRVTPDGVVVPVALTHALLGRLTAAKRPTVSVALATLAEDGIVLRRPEGGWLLTS